MQSIGLTDLSTRDLENVLRALHREQLSCPITPTTASIAGLSYLFDRLQFLRGLDRQAVHAVLVATLAERRACEERLAKRG